jgi:hypothetical protein
VKKSPPPTPDRSPKKAWSYCKINDLIRSRQWPVRPCILTSNWSLATPGQSPARATLEWALIGPDGLAALSPGTASLVVRNPPACTLTISLGDDVTDLPVGRYIDALRLTTVKNGRNASTTAIASL